MTTKCKRGQSALAGGFAAPALAPADGDGPGARFTSEAGRKDRSSPRRSTWRKMDLARSTPSPTAEARPPPKIRSKRARIAPVE